MWAVWLKSRRRIGMKMFRTIYSEPVKGSRANIGIAGKITALLSLKWVKCALGSFFRALLQHKIDLLRFWRPDPEMRFVYADQFRSDRITPFRMHIILSPLDCALALQGGALSFHVTRKNNMRMPAK